jgi:hypothetical protein
MRSLGRWSGASDLCWGEVVEERERMEEWAYIYAPGY